MSSHSEFTLTGFEQEGTIRHFRFESTTSDLHREFTVDADTGLLGKYGITLQELPLLCLRLLERQSPAMSGAVVILNEAEMQEHADHCAAIKHDAEEKRQRRRKPSGVRGQAWRGPRL